MSTAPGTQLLDWLSRMLLIRRFEEAVIKLQKEGLVPGHTHVYIGQEATAVAASACLAATDTMYVTHRNHGHLLARGADPGRLLAEILGRATGYNRGRGGTMHPVVPELGIRHTSAMVGGILPLATGSALAAKRAKSGQVSAAFFGDGSLEEGVFSETINLAVLWKLPVVYLCENNSLEARGTAAGETPSSTLAAARLTDVPAAFGMATAVVDGADPEAVHPAMAQAVARARQDGVPTFLEARTVRWPGTRILWPDLVTGETDLAMAWKPERIPGEYRAWFETHDPVLRLARLLVGGRGASPAELGKLDRQARERMEEAVSFAVNSPLPAPESALEKVFTPKGAR